jgi:hypothetical protein
MAVTKCTFGWYTKWRLANPNNNCTVPAHFTAEHRLALRRAKANKRAQLLGQLRVALTAIRAKSSRGKAPIKRV